MSCFVDDDANEFEEEDEDTDEDVVELGVGAFERGVAVETAATND